MRRSEKSVWLTILIVELAFVVLTRVVLAQLPDSPVGAELLRTVLRLVAVLVYLKLIPVFINFKGTGSIGDSVRHPMVLLSFVLFLSIPFLAGNYGTASTVTRLVFALASFPVALKEEITFRALIQNLLAKRFGTLAAVLLATTFFVCYHIGVIAPGWVNYARVATVGLFLGVLYARSQSLWLVIGLHTVYDAVQCVGPVFSRTLSQQTSLAFEMVCLVLILKWSWTAIRPRPAH